MARSGYTLLSAPGELVTVVQGLWVCLVAFSGACAVLGARFGSCEDGPPNLLYIIFAVLLLAVEAWQFRMASDSDCCDKLWFVVV